MAGIRADWLGRTDAAVERLSDDLAATEVRTAAFLLQQFLEGLEPPPDSLHGAVLAAVLMDVCGRVVQALHAQCPAVACSCDATIWSHVSRFSSWREGDPRSAFRNWLQAFFESVDRNHPADAAVRAAQMIRRNPAAAWTLGALAGATQSAPARLRREFETRFDMRHSAYLHLIRTTRALALLRTTAKVEAVAWEVGYRSKKDLYAALRRWTGLTPTQLRELSDDECNWLERELRIRGLRHTHAAGDAGRPPQEPIRRRGTVDARAASGTRGSRQ